MFQKSSHQLGSKEDIKYISKPNYEGYILIGAGLPRTGTTSLRLALSHLLNGPVHHMVEVFENDQIEVDFWNQAMDKTLEANDWKNFFEGRGFRSSVDNPTASFYREIMKAYPNAKIILSVRDPKKWYRSVKNTIFYGYMMNRTFPTNIFCILNRSSSKGWENICDRLAKMQTNGLDIGIFDAIAEGEDISVTFYNDWISKVKETVPEKKLLIFDVKEGWRPLCQFLDVPVPKAPFPWENDTAHLQNQFRKQKILAYLTIFGIPIVVAGIIYFTISTWMKLI